MRARRPDSDVEEPELIIGRTGRWGVSGSENATVLIVDDERDVADIYALRLRMDFHDYLCKPVEKTDLVAAIEQQLRIRQYDDQLSEYFEVTSKLALLEQEPPSGQLDEPEELTTLRERAEDMQTSLDDTLAEFDDIDTAFQQITRYQH